MWCCSEVKVEHYWPRAFVELTLKYAVLLEAFDQMLYFLTYEVYHLLEASSSVDQDIWDVLWDKNIRLSAIRKRLLNLEQAAVKSWGEIFTEKAKEKCIPERTVVNLNTAACEDFHEAQGFLLLVWRSDHADSGRCAFRRNNYYLHNRRENVKCPWFVLFSLVSFYYFFCQWVQIMGLWHHWWCLHKDLDAKHWYVRQDPVWRSSQDGFVWQQRHPVVASCRRS